MGVKRSNALRAGQYIFICSLKLPTFTSTYTSESLIYFFNNQHNKTEDCYSKKTPPI